MLVSCLMPTADRPERIRWAIEDFLRQDYPERELVILDDGEPAVTIPDDPRIRLHRHAERQILGWKREALVQLAQGDVLILWDDDDWHGPRRISVQLEAIQAGSEASAFSGIRCYDEPTRTLWETPSHHWLAPGTLAFTRRFHGYGAYLHIDVGADSQFIKSRPKDLMKLLDGREHYVMVRHEKHHTDHNFTGWQKLSSVGVLEFDVEVRVDRTTTVSPVGFEDG